jgi:hypothetical protein
MKNIFLILFSCLSTEIALSQSDTSLLGYQGGYKYLGKVMLHQLDMGGYYSNTQTDNRYFFFFFTVDKDGKIGKRVFIQSIVDSSLIKPGLYISALRATQGKWLNHTGGDLNVILPVIYRRKKDLNPPPLLNINYNLFDNGNPEKLIRLAPVIVEVGQTVS